MSHPVCYTRRMKNMNTKIEVTSPCGKVAAAVRQHLGLSTRTYELWFMGDMVGDPMPKNRRSLTALLKEAHQMLADAAAVGGVIGEAEIVYRWDSSSMFSEGRIFNNETVWSMSIDEFKKQN